MKRSMSMLAMLVMLVSIVVGCAHLGRDAAWVTLIDGDKGLENFTRVGEANWRAEDGAIVADQGPGGSFLVTKKPYRDFQLRAEFWASDDANSGIYMRCLDGSKPTDKSCYEANIFDQRPDPTYGTGAIVHLAPASPMPKAGGKWNTYDITLRGPRIIVVLNGKRTVDFEHGHLKEGPIALQWARGVIRFRKLQIREL